MDSEEIEADFSEGFLACLGEVLVRSNMLEEALIDVIWVVSRLDELALLQAVRGRTLGQIFVEAQKQCIAVDALGLIKEREAMEAKVDVALRRRNEFVHATWSRVGPDAFRRKVLPKTCRVRAELRTMGIVQVQLAIDEIWDAIEQTWALYDLTVERIPPELIPPRGGVIKNGEYTPSAKKS